MKLIVEGANGPTETAAEPIIHEKGIDLIPDILANSGGVVVSYYEWLQNKRSERWDLEEVEERLAKRMKRTYLTVSEYAAAEEVRLAHGRHGHRPRAHRPAPTPSAAYFLKFGGRRALSALSSPAPPARSGLAKPPSARSKPAPGGGPEKVAQPVG